MRRLIFVLLFAFPANSIYSQGMPIVRDYEIEAAFYPAEAYMNGYAKIEFDDSASRLDSIVFYLHGELWVDSIQSQNYTDDFIQKRIYYPYNYSLIATRISMANPPGSEMKVYYSGFFNPSKAAAISNYMRIEEDGVFLRSFGYSLWFPVFLEEFKGSHPVSFSSVKLKTPEAFRSIFIGHKKADYIEGGLRITEWEAPATDIFDAQCTAGKFEFINNGDFYIYHKNTPESRKQAGAILEFTKTIKGIYQDLYRKNEQLDEIHVIQMPEYGDISSGNVIGISSDAWDDFSSGDHSGRTLAHEIVHPFVKVKVEMSDPLFMLAIEGFPSYFHLPALREILGEEWYDEYMKGVETAYLNKKEIGKDRRGRPLPEEKPIDKLVFEEIGAYKDRFILNDRVKLFFNYLCEKMGWDKFQKFTRELFSTKEISFDKFISIILKYLPREKANLEIWLSSNDYLAKFHLDKIR
ncbi:MAG: hypothetical protein GF310_12305 [candidate division Zixibacteria bacterium]|nr:hypothetical protein [candidate division Zixibacteria bacterium]